MAAFKWQRNEIRRRMQTRGSESIEGQPLEMEARARLRGVLNDGAYREGDPHKLPSEYKSPPKSQKKQSSKRQAASLKVRPSSGKVRAWRADDEDPRERQARLQRELKRRARKVREDLTALEKAVQRKLEQLAAIERQVELLAALVGAGSQHEE